MLGKLLVRYLWTYKWWLLGVLVFQFASAMASLYLPRLNADIIDKGVATGDTGYIWSRGAFMLAIALGQIVASIIATYFAARAAAMSAGRDIRRDVYEKVEQLSEREVSSFGAGTLITRNTNDVQQVQMLAMMGATMLVTAPLLAIGGIIMALQQDVGLSWLIAVAVPVLLVIAGFIISRMVPLFRQYQDKLDGVNRVMREQLTGVRVVRAFVREPSRRPASASPTPTSWSSDARSGRCSSSCSRSRCRAQRHGRRRHLVRRTPAGCWDGADRHPLRVHAVRRPILIGVLMATFMTTDPARRRSADRIGEVLDSSDALVRPENPVGSFPTPGTVEFDDVSFTYPRAEAPVLQGISFRADAGETVAVVGSTGSGKTTLVSLIPRLFDVTGGRVRVGGVDVREADLDRMWEGIGYVPQRAFLFTGTVASNLRFGREEATDDELWHALDIAQGRDFVAEMEGGLNGRIAQGGTNVSGGQRQRLSIARAIAHRPDILVFDDSFSALDVTTDARLRQALWRELPHVTKIVVAQRISTITDADRIIVLDDGRMVGSGTHDELLATNETYREIVQSQLGVDA